MTRLLAVLILLAAPSWAGAQEFDDPAITVCELLVRPQFEVERNVYKRLSAAVVGTKTVLDFEWGVQGAKPKAEHVECPFRLEAGSFILDIPKGQEDVLILATAAIAASGLYPIPQGATALKLE